MLYLPVHVCRVDASLAIVCKMNWGCSTYLAFVWKLLAHVIILCSLLFLTKQFKIWMQIAHFVYLTYTKANDWMNGQLWANRNPFRTWLVSLHERVFVSFCLWIYARVCVCDWWGKYRFFFTDHSYKCMVILHIYCLYVRFTCWLKLFSC